MTTQWQHHPLGEVAPAQSLPMPPADAAVWNLSLEDIEGITGRILARRTCRVGDLGSTKCAFDVGHVLYSKLRPYLNKVVVPDSAGVGTSELIPLRPNDLLDREFLAFYLRSPAFLEFSKANTRGANLPRIAMAELWAHRVPVPPTLAEQRGVVARIKECMERVEELESLRMSSRAQQQHLSASLIESELHPNLTGEEGWSVRTVDELVTSVRNGRSIAQDTEGRADGAVLTLTAVRGIDLGGEFQKPIALPDNVAQQFGIDEGDVFVSRANTIELVGLAAVAEEKPVGRLIYPDLLIKLKADRAHILPRYLAYALRSASARKQIKARALGSSQTMVKISGERLREVRLPVPSLHKQAQIISRLDTAHELIRALATEYVSSEAEGLRGAILRKAFAGEL